MLSILLQLLALCAVSGGARAHLQLSKPLPINSPLDSRTPESKKDYSYTNPLEADGSNYPGKGYATPEAIENGWTTDTLTAGESYQVTMEGTATHEGGSGQFALSYDGGETFLVMASYVGGFPLALDYTFTVPEDVPAASKALFSWTWFNKVGNREEYQNLAIVEVVNSNAGSWTAPRLFRANTLGDSACEVPEGTEVIFPNPGSQVFYGGMWADTNPSEPTTLSGCSYDQSRSSTVSSDDASSSGAFSSASSVASTASSLSSSGPPSTSSSANASSSSAPSSGSSQQSGSNSGGMSPTLVSLIASSEVSSSSVAAAPSSSSVPTMSVGASASAGSATTTSATGSCTDGELICSDDGQSFSMCTHGEPVSMGKVAAGTECSGGSIVQARARARRHQATRFHRAKRQSL